MKKQKTTITAVQAVSVSSALTLAQLKRKINKETKDKVLKDFCLRLNESFIDDLAKNHPDMRLKPVEIYNMKLKLEIFELYDLGIRDYRVIVAEGLGSRQKAEDYLKEYLAFNKA